MNIASARIGFLGAGNMASAIAGGLVTKGLVGSDRIAASDIAEAALENFARVTCGGSKYRSNLELAQNSDIIIFATKPFYAADVCDEIKAAVDPSKLIVSICAGLPTKLFERKFGEGIRVVRVMPNTPALVGLGSTGVAGGSYATEEDVATVMAIFEAVGIAVSVSEDQLDLVTGLTGSGPAYFFRFAELLIDAGVNMGLEPKKAEVLVRQLMHGAGKLGGESPLSLAQLRQAVTTKGGTTEAGLKQLEEGDLAELVELCVKAATKRSEEFSKLGE